MRLAILAFLLLSACTLYSDPAQEEARIISPGNFKAGSGVITSIGVLRGANKSPGKDRDSNLYRLFLRMDLAGAQFVDVDSSRFLPDEAVELTNDGRVLRITGTTLNEAVRR